MPGINWGFFDSASIEKKLRVFEGDWKVQNFGGSRCRQTVDVVWEIELNGGSVHRLATVATVCSYGRQTVENA